MQIEGKTGTWELVIGLEVHAQVVSQSKLFSGAATDFGSEPNTQVSLVDAAFPGMLPVINRICVEQAIKTGLGINGTVNEVSIFDRKNYFYPDLPQGYQISQFTRPIVSNGKLLIDLEDGKTKEIGITRLHHGAGRGQVAARPERDEDLCRSEPLGHCADGDRVGAGYPLAGRGGRLFAQAALDPALSRHVRRQHGGRLHAVRRQRLGAQGRPALRHALRDQERQLDPLCHAGDRVRSAPPGRADRGGRHGQAGDAAL